MAGSKLRGKHWLKSSTLIETVISMVIIMAVFTIAMTIYGNVLQSTIPLKKVRAKSVLDGIMGNDIKQGTALNSSTRIDDIFVKQVIKTYDDNPRLMEVDLTAFDNNQDILAELKSVIQTNE